MTAKIELRMETELRKEEMLAIQCVEQGSESVYKLLIIQDQESTKFTKCLVTVTGSVCMQRVRYADLPNSCTEHRLPCPHCAYFGPSAPLLNLPPRRAKKRYTF